MEENFMSVGTCEKIHKSVDERFEELQKADEKEVADRKAANQELKEEFRKTNDKIDSAVTEIKNQWFKHLFSLLKWVTLSLIAMGGWILWQYATGKLKF